MNSDDVEKLPLILQAALRGPIRRTINLILALGLSAAGVGGFIYLLFFVAGWKGWMVMGSGMMGFLGLYWLWADFINADPRPPCARCLCEFWVMPHD
ncbi:MAG: hypothetical protein WB822_21275 [Rhodoplanes sp.]